LDLDVATGVPFYRSLSGPRESRPDVSCDLTVSCDAKSILLDLGPSGLRRMANFDGRRLKVCQIYSAAILSTPIFSCIVKHPRPILQDELVSHDLVDLTL
jgi:hypothetical protein